MTNDRDRWNERYARGYGSDVPNPRLAQYMYLLRPGLALDLAGGAGKNSRLLAGWTTVLADISERALERAEGRRVLASAPALPFASASFDTIICTYYYEPGLDLGELLKPGGVLFFETYTLADDKYRPDFPEKYRLDPSRLSDAFAGLATIVWEETDDGSRVYGTFVGQKE